MSANVTLLQRDVAAVGDIRTSVGKIDALQQLNMHRLDVLESHVRIVDK